VLLEALSHEKASVPQVFNKHSAYLRMYTQYVSNYPRAIETLNVLRDNKKFQRFISSPPANADKHAHAENGGLPQQSLSLMSYLIMPVQRIPRYVLLFKQLEKYTPPDHADHAAIQEALGKVEDLALHVNSEKKLAEDLSRLADIQTRIRDCPPEFAVLVPGRRLIQDGILKKTAGSSASQINSASQARVFLFNDMIMWTDLDLKFLGKFELQRFEPLDWKMLPGFSIPLRLAKDANAPEEPASKSRKKRRQPPIEDSFTLVCEDEEQTRFWRKTIGDAIEAHAVLTKQRMDRLNVREPEPLHMLPPDERTEVNSDLYVS